VCKLENHKCLNADLATRLVRKCYNNFNLMIALIRPVPGFNEFDKDKVNQAVSDFEILLDEVRELVR